MRRPESTTIFIPVTAGPGELLRCLRSVAAHTPPDVEVLTVGQVPADPEVERSFSALDRVVRHIAASSSHGRVDGVNDATAACSGDVVVLSDQAVVPEGWFGRMVAAGRSDSTVATASALTSGIGVLSVLDDGEPLLEADLERLSTAVAAESPRAYPRIPAAGGPCIWIARAAFDLVGPLDSRFRTIRGAITDFSQRCVLRGLVNVAADDALVASVDADAAASIAVPDAAEDRAALARRYPYLPQAVEAGTSPRLSESLAAARRAMRGLTVTIDARILRGASSGAHVETLELIETLARSGGAKVRALLDPAIGPDALAVLDRLPAVERMYAGDLDAGTRRSDVVHRPYQVTSAADLELLPRLGERLVITHLDLIGFHNPGYFESFVEWQQYRRITRQALAMADRAIFLSGHARDDALRESLIEEDRARVFPMAVSAERPSVEPRPPAAVPQRPFLLDIGNDFRHKNRLFAIRLLQEMRALGWDGEVVLAGANVGHGSSRDEEAAYLASRPELARAVHDLPPVDEAEKAWLYANAAAVVYPTTYEGFGLIPFEAARAGTPCLFAPLASLAELFPPDAAVLVPWDVGESARRALALLRDEYARRRHIELVSEAARRTPDWDTLGRELLEVYDQAARLPYREAAVLAQEASLREAQLSEWVGLGVEADRLIGEDAYLPRDVQQALLAAATRKRLRRPLFALLRALYATGYRARRL